MTETDPIAIEAFNAAVAQMRAGRVSEARALYERALAIQPDYVRAHTNLGVLLDDLGESAAAEEHFRAAIAIAPQTPEPWAGLGTNLRVRGRLDEARAAYERALALRPEFPAVRWNLAMIDLANGRFSDGWTNYLFRPSVDRAHAPLASLPEAEEGCGVEIVDEQGLGDALFFLRFFPALRERTQRVIYRPDSRLSGMVSRLLGDTEGLPDAKSPLRIALGDLPYVLGVADCPPSVRIDPLPSRARAMREALSAAGPAPYTGLAWRAGQRADGYLFKDVPLDAFGAALRGASGTLVSVQRAPEAGEHSRIEGAAGRRIADLSAFNDDLEDMLALMALLDDLICVSNTNVHLRAAAGRGGRVLVTRPAEYRWMAAGARSPWFPGFELYRQGDDGSWDDAFARLDGDVRA